MPVELPFLPTSKFDPTGSQTLRRRVHYRLQDKFAGVFRRMSAPEMAKFLSDNIAKAGYVAEPLEGPMVKDKQYDQIVFTMLVKDLATITVQRVSPREATATLFFEILPKLKTAEKTKEFIDFVNKVIPFLEESAKELEITTSRYSRQPISKENNEFIIPIGLAQRLGLSYRKFGKQECVKSVLGAENITPNNRHPNPRNWGDDFFFIDRPTLLDTVVDRIIITPPRLIGKSIGRFEIVMPDLLVMRRRELATEFLRLLRICAGIRDDDNTLEDYPTLKKDIEGRVPEDVMRNIKQMVGTVPPTEVGTQKERADNLRRMMAEAKAKRVAASKLNPAAPAFIPSRLDPEAPEFVPGRKGGRTRRRKHRRGTRRVSW